MKFIFESNQLNKDIDHSKSQKTMNIYCLFIGKLYSVTDFVTYLW